MPRKGGKRLYKRNGAFNMGKYFPVEDLRKFATTKHKSMKDMYQQYNKILRKAMNTATSDAGQAEAKKKYGGRIVASSALPPTPAKEAPDEMEIDTNAVLGRKRARSNASSSTGVSKSTKHNVVVGKTGRRFGRARKSRVSKYAKPGVQLVYETRSTVSDGQCVYAGYGVPVDQAIKSVFYCLVKKLFTIAGNQVRNFDEVIPRPQVTPGAGTYTIDLFFYASNKSTGLTNLSYVHDYTTDKITYTNAADNLQDIVDTFVTAAQSIFQIDWSKVVLRSADTTGGTSTLAEIPLDKTSLQLAFGATCRLQNVTQASGGTGDAKLSTDRIDINPIKGIKYVSQKVNNAILPRIRDDTTQAGYGAFMPDRKSGLFALTAANLTGGTITPGTFPAGMSQGFNKPPPGSSFRSVKTVGVAIEPGEIRHDKMYYKYKGSFTDFFTRVMPQLQDEASTTQCNFGKVTMFAFEHAVCQTTESNVAVDFQVDWKVSCAISFHKPATVPIVRIQ